MATFRCQGLFVYPLMFIKKKSHNYCTADEQKPNLTCPKLFLEFTEIIIDLYTILQAY